MTDQELKIALVARLRSADIPAILDDVDPRLRLYIEDVRTHCEGDDDVHNIDEIAACCKFLRMCHCYEVRQQHVKRFVKMYESFKFSGLKGRMQYKMTPIQVFMTAGIFLFHKSPSPDLPQRGGERRVVREAIIFIPRKFAKTTYLAALAVDDFLFGDNNGEVHIVANAEGQAKIAYKEAKALAMQLDPDGRQIRFTANEFNWKENQTRSSIVAAHTAGGKTKDGAFASIVLADEYGSAQYVKDHSDMADALNVYESSMGPRLNPLTVITTTAGKVIMGPFEQKLHAAQDALYRELDLQWDEQTSDDWQFMLAMHPDKWEYNEEAFASPRVQHKVNPHIGITVQPDYYELQWQKAKSDPEVYKETVTKLFNQFVSDSSKPWILADEIRRLQVPLPGGATRIGHLNRREWMCFPSFDFSKTDDLCATTYLCYNPRHKIFFCDLDAWICRKNLQGHHNSTLYTEWAKEGWINICEGDIIDDNAPCDALQRNWEHVIYAQFQYDAYDSGRFMGHIKNWMESKRRQEGYDAKTLDRYMKWAFHTVSQTFGNYNAVCSQLKDYVLERPQRIWFSPNPLWAWEFQNCVLMESNDTYENVKPVKRTATGKVDNVQALLSSLIGLNGFVPFTKTK